MLLQLAQGACEVHDEAALRSSLIAELCADLDLTPPLSEALPLPRDWPPEFVSAAFDADAAGECPPDRLLELWPLCQYLGLPLADQLQTDLLRRLGASRLDAALGLAIKPNAALLKALATID